MEAASTSETSVNFYQTVWRKKSEDGHLHRPVLILFWSILSTMAATGFFLRSLITRRQLLNVSHNRFGQLFLLRDLVDLFQTDRRPWSLVRKNI
jgi:hypothetical protein